MKQIEIPNYVYDRVITMIEQETEIYNTNINKLNLIEDGFDFGLPCNSELNTFYPHRFVRVLDRGNFIIESQEISSNKVRILSLPDVIVYDGNKDEYIK